jgi:hypothetical protein
VETGPAASIADISTPLPRSLPPEAKKSVRFKGDSQQGKAVTVQGEENEQGSDEVNAIAALQEDDYHRCDAQTPDAPTQPAQHESSS